MIYTDGKRWGFKVATLGMPENVQMVWRILQDAAPTYLVGGAVRDLLRGVAVHDWDLATALAPESVSAIAVRYGWRTQALGMRYGMITVIVSQSLSLEVATLRMEGDYNDQRHPNQVKYGVDIVQDLGRRDFTVNAMALTWTGSLIDPFGGQEDLQRHLLKAVGLPTARFREDPLRMWRAFRFLSQLGRDWSLDETVNHAIGELAEETKTTSYERRREEFWRILQSVDPLPGLNGLRNSGLWSYWWSGFHPSSQDWKTSERRVAQFQDPVLRLTALVWCCDAEVVTKWLTQGRFSNLVKRRVQSLLAIRRVDWTVLPVQEARSLARHHGVDVLLDGYKLAGSSANPSVTLELYRLADNPQCLTLACSGQDIMAWAEIEPGPEVRHWISLLEYWIDQDPVRNNRQALQAYVVQKASNARKFGR